MDDFVLDADNFHTHKILECLSFAVLGRDFDVLSNGQRTEPYGYARLYSAGGGPVAVRYIEVRECYTKALDYGYVLRSRIL